MGRYLISKRPRNGEAPHTDLLHRAVRSSYGQVPQLFSLHYYADRDAVCFRMCRGNYFNLDQFYSSTVTYYFKNRTGERDYFGVLGVFKVLATLLVRYEL